METTIAKKLLEEVGGIYDGRGMMGLCLWVREYNGNPGNKTYLLEVCAYLERRNGRADTRILGFGAGLIDKILDEVPLVSIAVQ